MALKAIQAPLVLQVLQALSALQAHLVVPQALLVLLAQMDLQVQQVLPV